MWKNNLHDCPTNDDRCRGYNLGIRKIARLKSLGTYPRASLGGNRRKDSIRKAGWVIMTVLCVIIAAYALLVLLMPGVGPPFIAERRALVSIALGAHLAGGLTEDCRLSSL